MRYNPCLLLIGRRFWRLCCESRAFVRRRDDVSHRRCWVLRSRRATHALCKHDVGARWQEVHPAAQGRGAASGSRRAPGTRQEPGRAKTVIRRRTLRNLSTSPIARLTVNEIWYDKDGGVVTGGRARINGLLQPSEIQVTYHQTPWNAGMRRQQLRLQPRQWQREA